MIGTVTLGAARWFRAIAVAILVAAALGGHPATAAPGAGREPVIAVVGDSYSAGYGLAPGEGWVDLLQRKLGAQRYPHRVVNASISGDTTAGGRARIGKVLEQHAPSIVVIELGGNDGLRGGSLQAMRENLLQMVDAVKAAKALPLLVGIELPPNYGPAYTRGFGDVFAQVAKSTGTPLVPSIVAGFGQRAELFQADRVHPVAAAQPKMMELVWAKLEPMLGKR